MKKPETLLKVKRNYHFTRKTSSQEDKIILETVKENRWKSWEEIRSIMEKKY